MDKGTLGTNLAGSDQGRVMCICKDCGHIMEAIEVDVTTATFRCTQCGRVTKVSVTTEITSKTEL